MKSFAMLMVKSKTSFGWNLKLGLQMKLNPSVSRRSRISSRSDFIHCKWIYSVRRTDSDKKDQVDDLVFFWLRRPDLNQRPSGYEFSIFLCKALFIKFFSWFDLHIDLHIITPKQFPCSALSSEQGYWFVIRYNTKYKRDDFIVIPICMNIHQTLGLDWTRQDQPSPGGWHL